LIKRKGILKAAIYTRRSTHTQLLGRDIDNLVRIVAAFVCA
jgi:hypothetical protein